MSIKLHISVGYEQRLESIPGFARRRVAISGSAPPRIHLYPEDSGRWRSHSLDRC